MMPKFGRNTKEHFHQRNKTGNVKHEPVRSLHVICELLTIDRSGKKSRITKQLSKTLHPTKQTC